MSHPQVQTISIVAAVTNGVAQAQSLGAAGNLTLNGSLVSGGVATLDSGGAARRLIISSIGDDHLLTWTITGTKQDPGNPTNSVAATETLAGANAGDAMSLTDFLTVTRIAGSGATAGNVTAGTNGTASAPAVPLDNYEPPFQASAVAYVLSGSPVFQLDVTYDDVFGTWLKPGQSVVWLPWDDLQGKTATAKTMLSESRGVAPVRAARWTLTAPGSIRGTILQQRGPS